MNKRVAQIRTEALAAEYIYSKKISHINLLTNSIKILTIIVPILLLAILLVANGSKYENFLNIASIIISSLLLSLSILSLIFHIDQKKENYIVARRSNIYVANEALKMIEEENPNLDWFSNYLVEMDSKDGENLINIPSKLRKKSHRYSLMKLIPGNTNIVCSICGSSPFKYEEGSCQTCGNTPKEK